MISSLNEAERLSKRFPDNRFLSVTLDNIRSFINRIHEDPLIRLEEIRQFERTVLHHVTRIRDQRDASLDDERMAGLGALLRANGFGTVHYEPYNLDDVLFAWTLRARWDDGA